MKTNYKNEIYKILEISYKHKVSHIPSALSQMMYFKYIIPRVKDFDWVAGKQFGWQAYVVYDERIKPEEIDVILLNGINKEFKYIEETLGNSLGVSIGLALTQDKPIWLNVSDSIFQMGRVLEALPLLKKFNSNILMTIDFNNISRSKDNLYQKHYLKNLMDIYGIKTIYINFENLNIKEIDNFINLSEPRVIIFETIKGFGVNSFIQDPVEWHYKTLNEIEYKNILEEL
jgi:hypothetical protein